MVAKGKGAILDAFYSESNADTFFDFGNPALDPPIPQVGNTFTSTGGTLYSAKWYLSKTGTPTGSMRANLYAITGTFGTTAIPTGAPLATSNNVPVSDITLSSTLVEFYFSGANRYSMAAQNYCVTCDATNASGHVIIGYDTSVSTYAGNLVYQSGGNWFTDDPAAHDVCFYVYKS